MLKLLSFVYEGLGYLRAVVKAVMALCRFIEDEAPAL